VNATVPTALAVAGTALMAVAFFGPFRRSVPDADEPATDAAQTATVQWPALVESSAVACDAQARIDLVDALGALQSEWAETILRKAYEGEPDPSVRAAIAAALSSSQSLVT
jgi:HEAT repeat protein